MNRLSLCPRCEGTLVRGSLEDEGFDWYSTPKCINCGYYDLTFPLRRKTIDMNRPTPDGPE